MLESKIESYLKKRVAFHGGHCRKLTYIGLRGAPDQLVMINGRIAFVELKAPGVKPRASQLIELDLLRAHGQGVYVIDSLQGVENFIIEMGLIF